MDLFFDLATNRLTAQGGGGGTLRVLEQKRGDSVPLVLHTYRGTVPEPLTGTVKIRFGLKQTLAGELLALADEWTEADDVHSAVLGLNSAELDAALADAETLPTLAEITISQDDGDTWISSQTVIFTVRNDVLDEDDGSPTALPGASEWLSARAIRYDVDQALSAEQRDRSQANAGIRVPGILVQPIAPFTDFAATEGGARFLAECPLPINGKPAYTLSGEQFVEDEFDGFACWYDGGNWQLCTAAGGYPDGNSGWDGSGTAATPDLVPTWSPYLVEDTVGPLVTPARMIPSHYVLAPAALNGAGVLRALGYLTADQVDELRLILAGARVALNP
jgi:hypothetical protein